MDPLSLLREFNMNKDLGQIAVKDDRVDFGNRYSFPKTVQTAYKSQNGKGDFYSLETLLFFLQKKSSDTQTYIKETRENNVPAVSFIDRKMLLQYLDGEVDAAAVPYIADASELPVDLFFQQDSAATAKRPRPQDLDDEAAALRTLLSQERQLRNRNSMLLAPNRDFSKVLTIVQRVEAERRARHSSGHGHPHQHHHHSSRPGHHSSQPHHRPSSHRHHQSQPAPQDQGRSGAAAIPVKPSGRFERDATQDQLRAMGGEAGLKLNSVINIYGGSSQPARGGGAGGQPTSTTPQPKPAPPGGHPSFSRHAGVPSKSPAKGGSLPIILVPSGMTSLITKYNAAAFLQDGSFIESAVAKAQYGEAPPSTIKWVAPDGKERRFQIMDALQRESPLWKHVVAVICQGAKWQFKTFPFKGVEAGDLMDTFSRVVGFYLHYQDTEVPAHVKSWNVKCMGLPRSSRHQDATLKRDFFLHLDRTIQAFQARRKAKAAAAGSK